MASGNSPLASVPTSGSVTRESIEKAVNALIKWNHSKTQTHKPQLLDQDQFIYLIVTLKKIPQKSSSPHKIALPHPLYVASGAELCLIIDDRSKSRLTSDAAKKKVQSEDIPVSKVLKLSKLKTDYREFEKKRQLYNSYDLFMADKRIVPLLPRLLGKQFFKNRKIPVPVDLSHGNWKEQIERICASTLLYLRTGTCNVVSVGRASLGRKNIVENVAAAIEGVVEVVPRKWANVRSLHLKFAESLALPVYQALPGIRMKIEGVNDSNEGSKEGKSGEKVLIQGEKKGLKKNLKEGLKKGPKRGRIDQSQCTDSNVDELLGEDDLDSGDGENEKCEHDEMGGGQFGRKKRKVGTSMIRLVK